jgi:streptomycin 6-kinase
VGTRPVDGEGRPPPHPEGGRQLIEVGAATRERARQLGPAGLAWLAELHALVVDLEREWSLTVGEPLSGGTAAYVARVRTAHGGDAVLKLVLPDPDFANQARTLVTAAGRGYVRVLRADLDRQALLLEALGPSMDLLGLPPERMIALLTHTLRDAWRVPPWPELAVAPGQDKASQLAALVTRLWDELDRPCPERVVAQALEYARRRAAAFDPARCVVVHGDPHPANALSTADAREFVFVDPDGFLADPAYDLGVVLREWCAELLAAGPGGAPALARRYCDLLAGHTGADPVAVWEWGFLERVSSGLYLLRLAGEDHGRPYLASAELLTA